MAQAGVEEPVEENLRANLVLNRDRDLQAQLNDEPFYAGIAENWHNGGLLHYADDVGGQPEGNLFIPNIFTLSNHDLANSAQSAYYMYPYNNYSSNNANDFGLSSSPVWYIDLWWKD